MKICHAKSSDVVTYRRPLSLSSGYAKAWARNSNLVLEFGDFPLAPFYYCDFQRARQA
jgi:hypothetical protein